MKPLLLFLTLLTATSAWAQQPSAGFGRKLKTTAPTAGLAERLNALTIPLPKDRAGRQTLTKSGGSPVTLEPLRLRVVRDTVTGLPIFIERKTNPNSVVSQVKKSGARLSAAAAASTAYQFMGQVRGLLKLDNPEANFTVTRTETDEVGQMHIRLAQTHRGVPVLGSELVAHLTDHEVTLLNGRYQPIATDLSVTPKLTLVDASAQALTDVRKTSNVRSFGDNMLNMKSSEGELCVFPTPDGGAKLAYAVTVRPNMLERWEYVIDAQTGDVLDKYNHTCSFVGPIKASGKDLNGATRSFQTYQQTTNSYYLIDASRSMFKPTTSKMPDSPIGALWTVDARNTFGNNQKIYQITSTNNTDWNANAISAHYNAGVAYDYYKNTHNRDALSGTGETMVSVVNMPDDDGKSMDNAYWNGKIMAYGNGKLLKPLAGGLDVAGHEMTHGVIQNTANLQYKSQSGAINESFADVFGAMIDRDNWTIGESIATPAVLPSGALRNLSNPNQGGKSKDPNGYQPATMSQYETTSDDNGGVHSNSGIPNFAFYKFATVVGKEKAEKVYYQALTKYLVRTSQFLDLRLAVIKAAGDLYGATGAEVSAAKSAFDAVGITDGTTTTPKTPDVPVASGQDLLLLADATTSKLFSTTVGASPAKFDAKSALGLVHRPSVTDDGKFAYYVTTDKRIRSVNLTGTPTETIISNETIWDNVAISKDGTKLAALTADKDGVVYVYSYDKKKWAEFTLYNPTYTQGVQTGDVQYADSFEWDFTGENIVYDAYNALKNNAGTSIDYWDVGFINVWSNATKDFAKGDIEKLFSNLDEGESIGNPSFSKNSPDVIAFDYLNETNDIYEVVAVDLNAGKVNVVYENNTLGFPSYSRLDNKLVFSTESGTSENISGINMGADKITPSGSVSVLYTGAKWPVWYTQGTRVAKATQTITFDPIPDRFSNQGDLALKATCSSNLTVGFLVKSGPATLSGSTLKFTGVGAVTIQAFQNGNEQFSAASAVERTFNVLTVTGTEPAWADALSIYPNPAGNTLTVELPGTETIEQLSLQTLTGATVARPTIRTRQRTATLEVGSLPKGLYLLQIQTPSGTATKKIMKE
ncbi:T9SS type A sorting domain-containing protein [Spirosoma sp. KCTC 42546]|uniref:M4 family metallopeptidase n=1 Tax=Spirosoma sp. KCTC 42546 TaxID=2520506 RepID=UPI001158949C|nr:M4 family metallopeptidase [Spirosoma sp. KCTC 42546]QDK82799.1 T9SS type A sorting domain-containing protein [Spirosoma sp. KCTC 42546]